MSTKCANTPVCWSCSAPLCIEFAPGADMSKFSHARGLIYEGNMLHIKSGMVRQGYATSHLSVVPSQGKPFTIAHKDVIRVAEVNGGTIWENALREKQG